MDITKEKTLSVIKYKLSSPTTVWFGSLYMFSLLSMIINNIFRQGLSLSSVLNAPMYYSRLFYNYGINVEGTFQSVYETGIGAWIMAPFISVWLGLALFYLRDSGYSYNSTIRRQDIYLPAGDPFYSYFSEDVFGAGITLFGSKGNMFYLSIVWSPIIFASIATVFYKRWTKRESWIVTRFTFNFLIAIWIGITFARITDPSLSFSIPGLFESLFVDRKNNHFVNYDGHYHPTMIALFLTMIQIVPIIVLALFDGMVSFSIYVKQHYIIYQKRQEYLREKEAQGITSLPWEDEEIQDRPSSAKPEVKGDQ